MKFDRGARAKAQKRAPPRFTSWPAPLTHFAELDAHNSSQRHKGADRSLFSKSIDDL
jgi:hypothetical protein